MWSPLIGVVSLVGVWRARATAMPGVPVSVSVPVPVMPLLLPTMFPSPMPVSLPTSASTPPTTSMSMTVLVPRWGQYEWYITIKFTL